MIYANLKLGWCQGYMAIQYHMEEAFLEAKIKKNCVPNPDYALFSHKYINEINELNHKKNTIIVLLDL